MKHSGHLLRLRYPAATVPSVVEIRQGALALLGRRVHEIGARRVVLITDRRVHGLWGTAARRSLRVAGIACDDFVVAAGERSKSPVMLMQLWSRLAALELDRSDAVVALGGGVVGDLAGFAAATWLRGVPWIAVPTSLLAQVDSSVGGKTAIDLPAGKNLVGAFHQPRHVIVDPLVLSTLPPRHLRAGLAEVAKKGMAVDAPLFRWLERQALRAVAGEVHVLEEAVLRSIRAKARVVVADEREREGGRRTALNYGHTLGHALEACLGYRRLLHGEAVAVGMRVAAGLSSGELGLGVRERARQDALLDRIGLRHRIPGIPAGRLLDAMANDKKRRNGRIRWVLTPRIGHASVPRLIDRRRVEAALIEAGAS